jgi:putative PIG3 family NAD(P)H quinone oxidoreductase
MDANNLREDTGWFLSTSIFHAAFVSLDTMKAVIITRPGGPDVLEIREVPTPQPGLHEVLVRVHAAGLNRADILQRQGHYPAPPGVPPDIPGLEFAGEIAALGAEATAWRVGQRVFGIAGGGCQAEYIVVHQRMLAEIPANLNWSQAAAVPEVLITAHDALWRQAALAAGETVLIHAVGSGVGLAAVQLSRAIGAVPYGTSRTPEKIHLARHLGLEDGIAVPEGLEPLKTATRQWTADRGYNVVLDLVGGAYLAASLEAVAIKGRVVLLATMAGRKTEMDLGVFLYKRVHLIGSVLRSRALEEKIAATQAFAADVVPLLAEGKVRPTIDREFGFALQEVQGAYRRLESNEAFGKIVLRIAP